MNNIQKEYLEILKTIDSLCMKESLSYMLNGGTLLGAVRENGFIAWDDDGDIMMHRKEFRAFETYCSKDLDNHGLFIDYNNIIPKIALKQNPKIGVEIILIDSMPKNKLKYKYKRVLIKILRVMLMTKRDIDNSDITLTHKPLEYGLWFLSRVLNQNLKVKFHSKACQIGNNENSDLIFFSNERWKYMKWTLNKNLLAETTRKRFEDVELVVPKEWDAFLRLYYGENYMIPKRENYYA